VRIAGHGHPAIRATHDKTLEISPDPEISERATCVVAVDGGGADAPMAGDVRITIRAGGESFSFAARANSSWEPGGTAIVRRSGVRLPGTFATNATAAARDLPRSLVAALRAPGARIEVDIEPVPGRRAVVLYALDPRRANDPRLGAELAAADQVVPEDEEAARAVGRRISDRTGPVHGRVLVVATRDLPGASVARQLADVDVETVGLPPALAAAAASPARAPVLIAPADTDPRDVLRDAPAAVRLVLAVPGDRVAALLRLAHDLRGCPGAVLAQPYSDPLRVDADNVPSMGGSPVHICLDPAPESGSLDPRVHAAIATLLTDGVPTKTAAAALAALSGWDRRRAYESVLAWRQGP
jgi:hypothetical protein